MIVLRKVELLALGARDLYASVFVLEATCVPAETLQHCEKLILPDVVSVHDSSTATVHAK